VRIRPTRVLILELRGDGELTAFKISGGRNHRFVGSGFH
jgi:hypothetical protein